MPEHAPSFKDILIFTDGACSGNPGPGGWAAVVVTPEGEVNELAGREDPTTNNRMELLAVINALKFCKNNSNQVQLYTDSTYVIRGITQWIWGWRKGNFVNAEGAEVKNRDLWEILSKLIHIRGKSSKVHWHYSRGHVGTPGNERCDEIAVSFSQKKYIPLYQGSLLKYSVPIFDLPEITELPEMRPKAEKVKPYSYLSLLNGKVYRHQTWSRCEARVKGKPGAKFKKALSPEDELKILKEWNLDTRVPILDESL